MKSVRYLAAILVFFIGIGAANALAGETKNVLVTNNTPYTLMYFYASPSSSSNWSSTNLLTGQIQPGQQAPVAINDGLTNCTYDLMAVLYGASQYAYTYQVNVCNGGSWTLHQ